MGRQFIAVVPNGLDKKSDVKTLLGKLKRTAEGKGHEARWTPQTMWHVTLQFLGDIPPEKKPQLKALLEKWKPQTQVTLRLHGLGAFPETEGGRVLWIGVNESQDFLDLQAELAGKLTAAGFELGDREFKPHLTLARFRNLINLSDLVQLGGRKHFGDYAIAEIVLFESVLQGNILKYMPQLRIPLAANNNKNQ